MKLYRKQVISILYQGFTFLANIFNKLWLLPLASDWLMHAFYSSSAQCFVFQGNFTQSKYPLSSNKFVYFRPIQSLNMASLATD